MSNLSKSKILAYRQCPKRLWLEIHKPELRDDSSSEVVFAIGNRVGEVARQAFDPQGNGAFIDIGALGHSEAIRQSATLLAEGAGPVFEAGVTASGALAYADVMLPDRSDGKLRWRMVEVKSSTSVKGYHRDDIAVQSFIAAEAGVPLASISVAHINSEFTYFGGDDYDGLFKVVDLTEETADRHDEVRQWLTLAHEIAKQPVEPSIETGDHCHKPFHCGFCNYCNRGKTLPEYPLGSLPRLHPNRRAAIEETGAEDLREAPDELLNAIQQRVKECSATGAPYFDAEGAAAALSIYGYPAYFLDFETIAFAVPTWEGTRPYQQIPFQFSLHTVQSDGNMEHVGFLDLSGHDPSQACAADLIRLCGTQGSIFAYNAGFESRVIRELAERFPDLAPHLQAIAARLVDLLPIARKHYYHPSQHGSWSIKAVLPALYPDLSYDTLDGVQDGNMAQQAYQEAIAPGTTGERKEQIRRQLHEYCKLDTLAMVRMWEVFRGASNRTGNAIKRPERTIDNPPHSPEEQHGKSTNPFRIRDVIDQVWSDYLKASNGDPHSSGVLTGFACMDRMTGGLTPGLHLLASRPAMGKTTFMLNIVEHMSVETKLPCLVFSADFTAYDLTRCMVFSRARQPARMNHVYSHPPEKADELRIRRAASEIADAPLFIEDSFDLTVESLQRIATRYSKDEKIGFIAIDHLNLLRSASTAGELSRDREIIEIVARIRVLARELNIPILLIAELTRKPESRRRIPAGMPRLTDIRQSNLIEGFATTISLLYRPKYYAETKEEHDALENQAQLIVCKNPRGDTGSVHFHFDDTLRRFGEDEPEWIR